MQTNIYCLFVLYCLSYTKLAWIGIWRSATSSQKWWIILGMLYARKIRAVWSHCQRHPWIETIAPRNPVEIIPWILQHIPTDCPESRLHSCSAQQNIKKDEPRTFDIVLQKEHDALLTLQEILISAPVLTLPCSKGHLTLYMDAFDKKVDCVLMEEQLDGKKTSVCYWPRTLNAAEQSYNTTYA